MLAKLQPRETHSLLPAVEQHRRREGLAAADRSNAMEGLPPPSAFARSLDERFARGEITADEAVAQIAEHYRKGR